MHGLLGAETERMLGKDNGATTEFQLCEGIGLVEKIGWQNIIGEAEVQVADMTADCKRNPRIKFGVCENAVIAREVQVK